MKRALLCGGSGGNDAVVALPLVHLQPKRKMQR